MRRVSAAVAVLVVLSGCSTSGGETASEPPKVTDVHATDTTGIILGVVLDPGIRPISFATITIQGDLGLTTTSNEEGAFGFEGLPPGTYFMLVSKVGYNQVQVSADVVAGVQDPEIIRVVLQADPSQGAFYRDYHFEGFLACSVRVPILGFAACQLTGPVTEPVLGEDVFTVDYEFDRVPDHVQVEMIWDSTQALGSDLSLTIDCFDDSCPPGPTGVNASEGPSPRYVTINRTTAEHYTYGPGGDNASLTIRAFAFGRADTDVIPDDQVNQLLNDTTGGAVPCVPHPLFPPGTCMRFTGFGLIIQQRFDVYTTIFYGYTPPKGWMFTAGDDIPQPPK